MIKLVDSHCHLDLIKNSTPETIMTTAHGQGIGHVLTVAVDLERNPLLLEIAQRLDQVSTSVGVHPNTSLTTEPQVQTLCELAHHAEIVAIGETGLDYYRSQGDLTWQRQRFRTHIRAAQEIGKPLIIHSREAAADTLQILREENAARVGGVMHCFVEDWAVAQQAMDMGLYISFSGIVTFKNATVLQEVAKRVPLDRLLVETDSPYLAPIPYRGKTNQPAYVKYVAQFIAELRQETFETIAQVTTDNFCRLFRVQIA